MARKTFQPGGYTVAKTVGSAAEGEDSLLALNNRIQSLRLDQIQDVWDPMKRIAASCALQRKIIQPGLCKIRQPGDTDDFLNYVTTHYIQRWRRQFEEKCDGRRRERYILNWIPYILGTITFLLIKYNKEVQDFDFLPLPSHETGDGEIVEDDIEDTSIKLSIDELTPAEMEVLINPRILHYIVMQLPPEIARYRADVLYYLSSKGKLISRENRNFVIVGAALVRKSIEQILWEQSI